MIIAAVLCIFLFLNFTNDLLSWWGLYLSIDNSPLNIKLIIGYLFYPIAFLFSVERNGDLLKISPLINIKIVANEFVAVRSPSPYNPKQATDRLSKFKIITRDFIYVIFFTRSRLIATYTIYNFGNISSLDIQIGVLSQLTFRRNGQVAKVAVSTLILGVVVTLTSASVAGMLIVDQGSFLESVVKNVRVSC